MANQVIITIRGKPFVGIEKGNERGLRESCVFVTAQAKRLVRVRTGQAKNSIMYKLTNRWTGGFNEDSGSKAAPVKLQVSPGKDSAVVGGNLAHLIYLEFGTRYMGPFPFLRPAGQLLNIDIAREANEEEMKTALKQGKKVLRFTGTGKGKV